MKIFRPKFTATLFLVLLSGILSYAILRFGGVVRQDRHIYLLALGLLVLLYSLSALRFGFAPALDPVLRWLVWLLPCYVAFQLVPLPLFIVRVLSPARAELADALAPVAPGVAVVPLSVEPPFTMPKLLLLAGYLVVFFLVREIAWQLGERRWLPVFPIIIVAALEAVLGLAQYASGSAEGAHGTYVNRNHFAGLLEMALPFAVMYPFAVLRPESRRGGSSVTAVLRACIGFAAAAVVLLAVIYSFSRMGLIAALGALFVMAVVGLGSRLRRLRWLAIAAVAMLLLVSFVVLSPAQLVLRFSKLSSTAQVTADDRMRLWGETLHLIAAYPLFGCGLGGYESALPKYRTSGPLAVYDYAHNDYLQLLAELGMSGFLIVALLTLVILSGATRAAKDHPRAGSRFLALACIGALAAILIHSLTDFNLYIPANAMVVAWISGLSTSLSLWSKAQPIKHMQHT